MPEIEIEVGPADEPSNRWRIKVLASQVLQGLALHRGHSRLGWTVTHIESGQSVMGGIPDAASGRVAIRAIAALADWTLPRDELEATKLKASMRKIARQVGAPAPRYRATP